MQLTGFPHDQILDVILVDTGTGLCLNSSSTQTLAEEYLVAMASNLYYLHL